MFLHALPFALAYLMIPSIVIGGVYGGWYLSLPFIVGWGIVPVLDRLTGLNIRNLDPTLEDKDLVWHRAVTLVWVPAQMALIVWSLWWIGTTDHLSGWEIAVFALGVGVATGGTGITFAHELIHQKPKWERLMGDLLLISTSYGHFATEHVFGHHITVATPKDPASARRGESFQAFFARTVLGGIASAWEIDANRLARRGRPVWHSSNPFWRYGLGWLAFLVLGYVLAGWVGVGFFLLQSFMAIYELEAVNYIEHYGLTREYKGNGKFERVHPHHSWNASQKISNWFLINLQRHSDHHFRPSRRYPVLQHYPEDEAPQLPLGYAAMIFMALVPPLWFAVMNKRVDAWRERFYPHVTDWAPYDNGTIGQEDLTAQAA
ncbi:MAG: alkane 1-monooxygenase [Pseudomonadota bacterium]